jgi:hypothetical protein
MKNAIAYYSMALVTVVKKSFTSWPPGTEVFVIDKNINFYLESDKHTSLLQHGTCYSGKKALHRGPLAQKFL